MCSRLSLVAVLTLMAAFAGPAGAVTVDDLHTATVTVAGKGEQARRDGFRAALEQVIVRLAGSSAALDNPGLERLLEEPAGFVQQYRYEPIERAEHGADRAGGGDDGDADDGDDRAEATHELVVGFAGARLERRLSDFGVAVWGTQRPEVLVWLAVDNRRGRHIVAADSDGPARRALMARARERALPVLLPLMDTEDRARVAFVDISGGFFDTVREASARYRAETMLVGHLRRAGGGWRGDWTLLGAGERRVWRAEAGALEATVAAGVDGAADRLAAMLAGRGGDRRALRARVRGIASIEDYARVTGYLDGLVRVRSHAVRRVEPGAVVFELAIQGTVAELERAVTLGDTLAPVDGATAGADGDGGDSAGRDDVPELVLRLQQ